MPSPCSPPRTPGACASAPAPSAACCSWTSAAPAGAAGAPATPVAARHAPPPTGSAAPARHGQPAAYDVQVRLVHDAAAGAEDAGPVARGQAACRDRPEDRERDGGDDRLGDGRPTDDFQGCFWAKYVSA